METRRAETARLGAKHDSAVGAADGPGVDPKGQTMNPDELRKLDEAATVVGWLTPVSLGEMVGCKVLYVNTDATPTVRLEGWLDGIDEGWAVIEFWDNSRATVRPSRIKGYRKALGGSHD